MLNEIHHAIDGDRVERRAFVLDPGAQAAQHLFGVKGQSKGILCHHLFQSGAGGQFRSIATNVTTQRPPSNRTSPTSPPMGRVGWATRQFGQWVDFRSSAKPQFRQWVLSVISGYMLLT